MKHVHLFMLTLFVFCKGYSQDFTVNNYNVDITINEKGYFDVDEHYDLNFEIYKHGIYRTILTEYNLTNSSGSQEKRKIEISRIKVPNYTFDAPFGFVQKLSKKIDIKIGDKDKTLIGPQHYEIKYRVKNAFLFEASHIGFYWNIKPDGWAADFHKISFKIQVPEDIQLSKENCFVYSGDAGNTNISTDFNFQFENNVLIGTSKNNFVSYPGQSVTVLINLPLNSIHEIKPLWPFWNQYGWVFLIGVLIASFYAVWDKYGKDQRVIATTSYYAPKNIDPAMAGFLINDREDTSDLISLIPHWGSKGYIRIEEIDKKWLFGKKDTKIYKLKPLPDNSPDYELKIFKGLFADNSSSLTEEVLVSSLKDTFYTTMASAAKLLKEKAQPYYEAKSKKVQTITYVVLVLLTILLTIIALVFWGLIAAITLFVSCVMMLFLNSYMIKKNAVGNQLLSELKGFKRFIKVAEENKLKMLLKDDPGYFENTMGYALAFGMFEKWTRKFEALNIKPPNWYASTGTSALTMHNFSRSFSRTIAGTQSNMVSSPKSSGGSGGGSSGGGFGGGGGGSW
jgi:uncharacterized membrane protein YgcG